MHIHKYTKWSEVIETYSNGHKQQWRVCKICNKADFRTLGWDKQTEIQKVVKAINEINK